MEIPKINQQYITIAKSIFESKTFWIAVIQAVLGLLAVIVAVDPSIKVAGIIAMLKSILDIINRLNTTQPVVLP